jgi:DNA polymerase-4
MDAFFASCEEAINPSLRNKPLIVGGTKQDVRSIVACPNYLARQRGVKTAMAITKAIQLVPEANFIRGTRGLYSTYSKKVREIFYKYTPLIQPISIDEAYLDVTNVLHSHNNDPVALADKIKDEIKDTLDITCSIGISTGKVFSKIASKVNKPNGVTYIEPGKEKEFLANLPVERIPGVGKAMLAKLNKYDIRKIGDILKYDREFFENEIGDYASFLINIANGIDHREVHVDDDDRKSLSKETTFDFDTNDLTFLRRELNILMERACFLLRKEKTLAKTVTVKIKYFDFKINQKSYTRPVYSNLEKDFYEDAMRLLEMAMASARKIRLLGIRFSELIEEKDYIQEDLFIDLDREKNLISKLDQLRTKYNFDIVKFGKSME